MIEVFPKLNTVLKVYMTRPIMRSEDERKNETFFYIIRKDSHHYARGKTKLSPYSVYFLYRKCYYRIVISEVLKDYAAKIVEIKVLERCVQQLINMLHCFSEFYIVVFISF